MASACCHIALERSWWVSASSSVRVERYSRAGEDRLAAEAPLPKALAKVPWPSPCWLNSAGAVVSRTGIATAFGRNKW